MFALLNDPNLPALKTLGQADLERITGTRSARLLRARYQRGARAILHVRLGDSPDAGEGAIWFYAGSKAQGLVNRLPEARLDTKSGALFEAFPYDHRLPQLAHFVAEAMDIAPQLIGGKAGGLPALMRYRPGLSATFRWSREDGRVFYVKLTPKDDVAAQAVAVSHLVTASQGLSIGFTPVEGVIKDLGLIAYAAAKGQTLESRLIESGWVNAKSDVAQVARALGTLATLPVTPSRILDRATLLSRADQASRMIALLDTEAGEAAFALVAGLKANVVPVRLRTIHGDMKLEHAFLAGPQTTFIDTESLSLGDPDYDLAKLEARTVMASLIGQISEAEASLAMEAVRPLVGPSYAWFLNCARLQCAKYFAQRFDPAAIPVMRKLLQPW